MIVDGLSPGAPRPQRLFAAVAASHRLRAGRDRRARRDLGRDRRRGGGQRAVPLLPCPAASRRFRRMDRDGRPRRGGSRPASWSSAAVIGLLPFDDSTPTRRSTRPRSCPGSRCPLSSRRSPRFSPPARSARDRLAAAGRGRRVLSGSPRAGSPLVARRDRRAPAPCDDRRGALRGRSADVDRRRGAAGEVVPVVWDTGPDLGRRRPPCVLPAHGRPLSSTTPSAGRFASARPATTRTCCRRYPSRRAPRARSSTRRARRCARRSCSCRARLASTADPVARSSDGRLALMHTDGTVRLVEGARARRLRRTKSGRCAGRAGPGTRRRPRDEESRDRHGCHAQHQHRLPEIAVSRSGAEPHQGRKEPRHGQARSIDRHGRQQQDEGVEPDDRRPDHADDDRQREGEAIVSTASGD